MSSVKDATERLKKLEEENARLKQQVSATANGKGKSLIRVNANCFFPKGSGSVHVGKRFKGTVTATLHVAGIVKDGKNTQHFYCTGTIDPDDLLELPLEEVTTA